MPEKTTTPPPCPCGMPHALEGDCPICDRYPWDPPTEEPARAEEAPADGAR